ncbi:MAG TPA: glycerophosphodiester phosphodiesterase [Flavisolibacter sp.]|nr:glycerophosphodiester phosphodiesterase [Flavisolibacter sp.]
MRAFLTIIFVSLVAFACKRNFEAPVPDTRWDLFEKAGQLSSLARPGIEGVYNFQLGSDVFGASAAAKWSYTATGTDTAYHLSLFCEKEVAYFILEGKKSGDSILFNGYWRKMVNTETGIARFIITSQNGARQLLNGIPFGSADSLVLKGVFGYGQTMPDQPLLLKYNRPLYNAKPLQIVAHRGGGSTADLLPASENSVAMINMASRFGATGIEIDVRSTSDKVFVLFHDATLNERLIQKNGLLGPIENYSYDQLYTLVRLKKGEHIPTLDEALHAVVYNTALQYVWLDTKFTGPIDELVKIQRRYMQEAAAMGRKLEITIGIPDQQVLNNFLALPDHNNIPSVCELTPGDVAAANSRIWAPRWTLGLQNEQVQQIHAQGRRAFVWTLDVPQNVSEYMYQGEFDGILSNYPSIVAYYYYAKQ